MYVVKNDCYFLFRIDFAVKFYGFCLSSFNYNKLMHKFGILHKNIIQLLQEFEFKFYFPSKNCVWYFLLKNILIMESMNKNWFSYHFEWFIVFIIYYAIFMVIILPLALVIKLLLVILWSVITIGGLFHYVFFYTYLKSMWRRNKSI